MTRYFFDVENGDGPLTDEVGKELANLDAVRAEIVQIMLDLAGDEFLERDDVSIKISARENDGPAVAVAHLNFSHQLSGSTSI